MTVYFLTVDPGFAEVGSASGYYEVDVKEKTIAVYIDDKSTEAVVDFDKCEVEQLVPSLNDWITRKMKPEWLENDFEAIVEKQYIVNPRFQPSMWHVSVKLNCFQTALAAILISNWRRTVVFINSKTYKTKLGLTASKTAKDKRYEAKKLAVAHCMQLLSCEKKDLTHHVADAINQFYWHLTQKYEGYKISFF